MVIPEAPEETGTGKLMFTCELFMNLIKIMALKNL